MGHSAERDAGYRGCLAACARTHAPIVTAYTPGRERGTERGTDRVVRTHAEAVALAARRAPSRGRQTVRRHVGRFLKSVWVVQDYRPSPPADGAER